MLIKRISLQMRSVSAAVSVVLLLLLAAVPADAQKILFGSERDGDSEIYVVNSQRDIASRKGE